MIVELTGVNFFNKGAQLMMAAVINEISDVYDNGIVAARIDGVGTFKQREQAGLFHLVTRRSRKVPLLQTIVDKSISLIPQSIRCKNHLVINKDVSAILNATGFGYGDQFGYMPSMLMLEECINWKQQGKKVVLLPQAFGPFKNPVVGKFVSQILEHVDLVFARDQVSYDHLKSLDGNFSHIKLAPDFTNLVKGRVPNYFNTSVSRPCIIPNYKMIDKTAKDIQSRYLPFLAKCIEYFFNKGQEPFILIHETGRDQSLAEELRNNAKRPIEIILEPDPLNLKGIIGCCSVVVSSRFHGLVSSLSQAIPSLGTGWSHKYQQLFEDYECPECLITLTASDEEVFHKLALVTDEPNRSDLTQHLYKTSQVQKELTTKMWKEVHKVLQQTN